MIKLKEPTKAEKSKYYLAVIKDADGTYHYWLPDGSYDGYCKKVKRCSKTKLKS